MYKFLARLSPSLGADVLWSDVCASLYVAVQNERDHIRVRRPAYGEQRGTTRPDGVAITTLHRAELLSREV